MTDIEALIAGAHRDRIAAFRYLAWLDMERRALVSELHPEHKPGDVVFFPSDTQVDAWCSARRRSSERCRCSRRSASIPTPTTAGPTRWTSTRATYRSRER